MNNTNRDILIGQLPIAHAQISDMAENIADANSPEALLLMEAASMIDAALNIIGIETALKYYHIEFNDLNDEDDWFLNSTVVTSKEISQYLNNSLVTVEECTKEYYDKYMEDYGDEN